MKIGELSQRTNCPITRIRFYEQKGLLPPPARTYGRELL
ncbi:MAG: MerR family DNA-binding transcriptional regulator [Anaerobiospirillum sp.]|nr:MerR family DNA-binding transcriptional regulator [Anaerobiospirillum sp.]